MMDIPQFVRIEELFKGWHFNQENRGPLGSLVFELVAEFSRFGGHDG